MNNFGERLKSARTMQGLSLDELADKLNNIVSKQSLSKYEQGKMQPSSEVFLQICNALNVRPDYFTREISVELEQVEFRKLNRAKEKEINTVKEKTKDFLERYFELEGLINEACEFYNPIGREINSLEEVEAAANQLRVSWKLGENPIPNVVEMLEENGVKVFESEAPEEFDGLSGWVGKTPVVVLNTRVDKNKLDRKRFTALHELAHLILKLPSNMDHATREKMCHRFASAILFPAIKFEKEFGKYRNHIIYKELVLLKEEWGMSVAAIVVRARDLEIISPYTYKNFWQEFAHFKKDEQGRFKGEEKSQRFEQLLLRAVAEEIITLTKAASLNNMKLAEFRDYLLKYD